MTVVHAADATVHAMHGSTFTSFVSPSRGSEQLCAWRLEIAPDTEGVEHVVTRRDRPPGRNRDAAPPPAARGECAVSTDRAASRGRAAGSR